LEGSLNGIGFKRNAINRIVALYEITGKPEKANEWRAKLPTTAPTTIP